MACTCRECLELAARGADVELIKCVAQDPLLQDGGGLLPQTPELAPQQPTSAQCCPPQGIQQTQIVPFGLDAVSASELEDPDLRSYIWELDDYAGHPPRNH